MNTKKLCLLLLFIFSFSILRIQAQESSKTNISLKDYIEQIEIEYSVSFSFIDDTIEDINILKPTSKLKLLALLDYLSANTNLEFNAIDDRFIIIRKISKEEKPHLQQLEEVIVTNYLTSGVSKTITNTIKVSPEDFGILPGLLEPDPMQSILALPGIISVDELVSDINIRGGTHDENLILWNGIKMYQSGHFFGMISAFNPYLTKDINISKNGTSVRYGDGVSGLIDMRSNNSINNEFKAGLGTNLVNVDGFLKLPLSKKTELQLSARKGITDLISTPTYNQYFDRIFEDSNFRNNLNQNNNYSNEESFDFYDISSRILYDITKKDKLRVNFISIYNDLNYSELSNGNSISNSELQQKSLAFGLDYFRTINKDVTVSAQVYYSTYDLSGINSDVQNNQRITQENEVEDLGIRLNLSKSVDDRLKLYTGYQFNEVGVNNFEDISNPTFRRIEKQFNRTHSIYGEAEFTSKYRKTYIRLGIRTNYIEQFSRFYTEPRISFSQKLSNALRLEILGEFKSQSISQIIDLQQDFLGIEKRRWLQANDENIPLIESQQISAGLHYNKNRLLISVEPFFKNVEGITTRSQGFQNQFQFANTIGKYTITGLDVLVNKQFHKFSTWISYSLHNNTYEFDNLNNGISFPNNKDVRHALSLATTYTENRFKLALGVNWHTGRPTTLPTNINNTSGGIITYNDPNSSRVNEYLRADFSANYNFKINSTKAVLGLSVWNIFDRDNTINTYFTRDNNNAIRQIDNSSLGITPNLSFRVAF
ncbi:TonB-dependent receptor [Ichthyenterobacterium sp. W332]|uniref:TonB-dependent receptor n=1 Tax=Microcosmobacter mediterraneus TaxID=3075607 RepID=A0ABU2YMB9_9FLAO|nr:TonB-dependent receptor [Ichthyenterobacterium sp. W332]MDT0559308.1 TonB-dependent receptor [Ichthyenterobacterium sp. W332]